MRLTIATCDGYPNKGNNTVNLPCVDFHSNEIPIRAVTIPFFAGFGIGIGTIECQKMPQFRIRIRIRIRIQHYITAGFGIGIGIKECQKMPQLRIRIRIQHRNYNSSIWNNCRSLTRCFVHLLTSDELGRGEDWGGVMKEGRHLWSGLGQA